MYKYVMLKSIFLLVEKQVPVKQVLLLKHLITTENNRSYDMMTTVNEIYYQFNIPDDQRMGPSDLDIGDYTFTDMNKPDPYVWDFTNKSNPDILFRVHEDRMSFILYKKLDDNHVDVTTWRLGKKMHKIHDDLSIFD